MMLLDGSGGIELPDGYDATGKRIDVARNDSLQRHDDARPNHNRIDGQMRHRAMPALAA